MPRNNRPECGVLARQRGQALIYGLFVLITGLTALFFLFNTGQLSSEKTKLVNTADAVAYSAGVMHARVLNFSAYTNRALMANEVYIAQMVSLSSWVQYAEGHANDVWSMWCGTWYSVPVGLGLAEYEPLCLGLTWGAEYVQLAKQIIEPIAEATVIVSEVAKSNLMFSQALVITTLPAARATLLQQVADANYAGDGAVTVDAGILTPLTDNYKSFDGRPFVDWYSGNDRIRFKEAELAAAYRDSFVQDRSWSSRSPWPSLGCTVPTGEASRQGATELLGFDAWRAHDSASLKTRTPRSFLRCRNRTTRLGDGSQSASTSPGGSDWNYSGVPRFFDLSTKALAYSPSNSDAAKRDPRLQFAVRLTRAKAQQKTSDGRAAIKPAGSLKIYEGTDAGGVMAAVATSEVFFDRFEARGGGVVELASLFNPYWQVHLVGNSAADTAIATAKQAGTSQ